MFKSVSKFTKFALFLSISMLLFGCKTKITIPDYDPSEPEIEYEYVDVIKPISVDKNLLTKKPTQTTTHTHTHSHALSNANTKSQKHTHTHTHEHAHPHRQAHEHSHPHQHATVPDHSSHHPVAQKPPAQNYKIYLIIDDAGQRLSQTERFLDIPIPMTISILPSLPATKTTAEAVQKTNKQAMLHQPMQAINTKLNPGPGAILSTTPSSQVPIILKENMNQVTGAKGMNNHMGSLVTQNRVLMNAVMAFCKENDFFFIDSFTCAKSIAGKVAKEYGVATAQQNIFLDNEHNDAYITKQFKKGMKIAKKRGFVIMIGHAQTAATARVIKKMYRSAQNEGYSFHVINDVF